MLSARHIKFLPKTVLVRQIAVVKRFYRRTNILQSGDKYEITLDQRKLKTPKGKIFEVSNKLLALAVAQEWDSQQETINRGNMHLTSLCSTVLDNPQNLQRLDMVNYIANYLETDAILFQSCDSEELNALQVSKWDPLIQWFCDRFQVDIKKTKTLDASVIPNQTKDAIRRHLLSYDFAPLQGFMYGVDILKSVILMSAVVERKIDVEEAVNLSRLEEEFQISHWGNVEWSHELSKQDLQARLAAASLFIHLNSTTMTSKPKLSGT